MSNAPTISNEEAIRNLRYLVDDFLPEARWTLGGAFRFDTSMKSKDSSLGMLMNDNSIALHVDTTIVNMSRLLEDFRLHPKRYVHFSLFGKKDK